MRFGRFKRCATNITMHYPATCKPGSLCWDAQCSLRRFQQCLGTDKELHLLQYEAAKNLTGQKCHDLLFAVASLNCSDKGLDPRTPIIPLLQLSRQVKTWNKQQSSMVCPSARARKFGFAIEQPAQAHHAKMPHSGTEHSLMSPLCSSWLCHKSASPDLLESKVASLCALQLLM